MKIFFFSFFFTFLVFFFCPFSSKFAGAQQHDQGLSPSRPHLSRGIRNKTSLLKKNLSNKSNSSSKRYNVFLFVRGVGVETRGGEGKKHRSRKRLRCILVQIDGSVILQIAKHARDSQPSLVTGQLLGLDVGSTLEVTSSFPFPSQSSSENNNTNEDIQEEEGALSVGDDANVARGERGQ